MRRSLVILVVVCCVGLVLPLAGWAEGAETPPDWQPLFEEVCGGTDAAMGLTLDELGKRLEQCVWLEERVGELDESRAKVYRKRLGLACRLYRFVLESKQAAP